jgi:hypothetical protein
MSEALRRKAENNAALFKKANTGNRFKWAINAKSNRDFFNNDQLDIEEIKALESAGMPTFIVNRLTPIVELKRYFATANNPRWEAIGRTEDDTDICKIHNKIADYSWELSQGKSLYSQVIQDSLVEGVGFFHVDIDSSLDRGKGEVIFRRIYPLDVYIDPASTDFLFRDAAWIQIKKNLSKSKLIEKLPQFEDKIKKASGNSSIDYHSMRDIESSEIIYREDIMETFLSDGSQDEIIDYYETYTKSPTKFISVYTRQDPTQEQINGIKSGVDIRIQEIQLENEVRYKEMEAEFKKLISDGDMIIERAEFELEKFKKESQENLERQYQMMMSDEINRITIIEEKSVTEKEWKKLQKVKDFMEIVVDAIPYYENRINVCVSIGADTYLYEKEFPTLSEYPIVPICFKHTGTPFPLSDVTFLKGKQREINKSHQILIHNASLGSSLRYKYEQGAIDEDYWEKYSSAPGALLPYRKGFEEPKEILPAPLNNAFFNIVQYGEREMEYIAGIYSSMQGDITTQHDTYKGMLANEEYSTRRVRDWMISTVEPALEQIGRVHMKLAQALYTTHKVFRIVQPEQVESFEINVPLYDDYGNVVERYNDYQSTRFDIKIVGGATMPVNKWALLKEYYNWYESGIIDDIEFLTHAEIANKDKIIERKSALAKAHSTIDGLENNIKDLNGTIETLQRQIVQTEIKNKILVANTEIQTQKEESKSDIEATERIEEALIKANAEILKLKQEIQASKKDSRANKNT